MQVDRVCYTVVSYHGITFVTIDNPTVYLSGARVSISPIVVPRLQRIVCDRIPWSMYSTHIMLTCRKQLPISIEVFHFLNFKRAKDKGPYHNTFVNYHINEDLLGQPYHNFDNYVTMKSPCRY